MSDGDYADDFIPITLIVNIPYIEQIVPDDHAEVTGFFNENRQLEVTKYVPINIHNRENFNFVDQPADINQHAAILNFDDPGYLPKLTMVKSYLSL